MKNYLLVAFLFISIGLNAQRVLKKESDLFIVTLNELSGSKLKNNEKVMFEMGEDYAVDGIVFIKRGTIVYGSVYSARKNKIFGKKGVLEVSIDSLVTEKGNSIKFSNLHRANAKSRGLLVLGASVVAIPLGVAPLVGFFIKGQDAKFQKGSVLKATVKQDFPLINNESIVLDEFNNYFKQVKNSSDLILLESLVQKSPDISVKYQLKEKVEKLKVEIKVKEEIAAKNSVDSNEYIKILSELPVDQKKLENFIKTNVPYEPLNSTAKAVLENVKLNPNKTFGYVYATDMAYKSKYKFETIMDLLRKDKTYARTLYYKFIFDLSNSNQVNKYFNEKFKNEDGLDAYHADPFLKAEYDIKIDDKNNIFYLFFTSGINKKHAYAFDPILGPIPFKADPKGPKFFEGQTKFYSGYKKIDTNRSSDYVLDFDPTTNEPKFYTIGNYGVTYRYVNNREKSINGSDFYLASVQEGSQKVRIKVVPSYNEKIQLYNASSISASDVRDPGYYYYRTETEGIYKEYLHSITEFPFFLNDYFDQITPLGNDNFIFKKFNKFGILSVVPEKWKDNNFVVIENVYDEIEFLGGDKLKGKLNGKIYFFNTNGDIISGDNLTNTLPPKVTKATETERFTKATPLYSKLFLENRRFFGKGTNTALSFNVSSINNSFSICDIDGIVKFASIKNNNCLVLKSFEELDGEYSLLFEGLVSKISQSSKVTTNYSNGRFEKNIESNGTNSQSLTASIVFRISKRSQNNFAYRICLIDNSGNPDCGMGEYQGSLNFK